MRIRIGTIFVLTIGLASVNVFAQQNDSAAEQSSRVTQQSDRRFDQWDQNKDGKLTTDELPKNPLSVFDKMDTNGDKAVTREELAEFWKTRQRVNERFERARPLVARKPTHGDVAYGDHAKQAFDIWLARSKGGAPTPLVIYIHGGGFRGGDKNASGQPIQGYLDEGISFASLNYRLSDVGPYPIMMHDCARALQLIRSKSKEWNLDSQRIACYGGSAGAGISLWLGFNDDLADPASDDPVARQSTRIIAAGTIAGQSTYDMRTYREWFGIPNLKPHPALIPLYAIEQEEDWETDRVQKLMTEASPINYLSKDDVPVFMTYGTGNVPIDENSNPGLWVHHVRLGIKLKQAMEKLGLECHVKSPDHKVEQYDDLHAFLREKVLEKDLVKSSEKSDQARVTIPIVSEETSPIEEIKVTENAYGVVRKPPGAGPFPVVIFLHGGLGQSPINKLREDSLNQATQARFLAWGYVTVNATRRKINHDPLDRGVVDDTVAMIEAVKQIPYVDQASVVLYGGSGGGTLAIETAGVADIAAVVAGEPATIIYMGMFNKDHIISDSDGKPTGDKRWDVMKADPKSLYTPELRERTREKIAKIDCPVLILHGDQHALKHFNLGVFIPEMKAMNKDVELILYPGENHGFYWGRSSDAKMPLKANRDADAFFRKHIATKPTPINEDLIKRKRAMQREQG